MRVLGCLTPPPSPLPSLPGPTEEMESGHFLSPGFCPHVIICEPAGWCLGEDQPHSHSRSDVNMVASLHTSRGEDLRWTNCR